jgi:PAS domain S-box-containing protein
LFLNKSMNAVLQIGSSGANTLATTPTDTDVEDELSQYKRLIDGITDYAIYMLEPNGVVASWNPGAERAKGYTRQEIIGRHFSIFYPEEDRARGLPQKALENARRDGRFEVEGWRVRKDGSRLWAHVIIDAIFEGGELVGFAKITRDASALRKVQLELTDALAAATAASEAKSAFLAMMSHEIRTPLNGVLGMAQAMAAGELTDVQRSRLRVIRESGQILMAILNDVLDISKIEAGQLEVESVEFDLGQILRGAQASFTTSANQKGVSLMFEVEQANGIYRGDPTRVRQIIYNLLSNALKFTSQGHIAVAATRSEAGLRFEVSDTGIGMSQATLDKLFTKFTQADAATTRQFGGTGLGLAICSDLAALLGGTIGVESVLGEGTTFTVELPFPYIGPPVEAEDTAAQSLAFGADLELRILIAEDNPTNQLVLKTLLNQVGIDPVVVSDGLQAVETWRTGEWDVLFMDIQMPRMDGATAALEIRRLEAEEVRPRTPIYALSANAMAHQAADYLKVGMDGNIAKPIDLRELFGVLEKVIEAAAETRGQEAPASSRDGRTGTSG